MKFFDSNKKQTNIDSSATESLPDLEAPLLHEAVAVAEEDFIAATMEDRKRNNSSNNDDDESSETSVIDPQPCNLLNGRYLFGFGVGFILQALSLYASGILVGANASNDDDSDSNGNELSVSVKVVLVFFSRYWAIVCMLLPPIYYASLARRRTISNKKNKGKNGRNGGKNKKED